MAYAASTAAEIAALDTNVTLKAASEELRRLAEQSSNDSAISRLAGLFQAFYDFQTSWVKTEEKFYGLLQKHTGLGVSSQSTIARRQGIESLMRTAAETRCWVSDEAVVQSFQNLCLGLAQRYRDKAGSWSGQTADSKVKQLTGFEDRAVFMQHMAETSQQACLAKVPVATPRSTTTSTTASTGSASPVPRSPVASPTSTPANSPRSLPDDVTQPSWTATAASPPSPRSAPHAATTLSATKPMSGAGSGSNTGLQPPQVPDSVRRSINSKSISYCLLKDAITDAWQDLDAGQQQRFVATDEQAPTKLELDLAHYYAAHSESADIEVELPRCVVTALRARVRASTDSSYLANLQSAREAEAILRACDTYIRNAGFDLDQYGNLRKPKNSFCSLFEVRGTRGFNVAKRLQSLAKSGQHTKAMQLVREILRGDYSSGRDGSLRNYLKAQLPELQVEIPANPPGMRF